MSLYSALRDRFSAPEYVFIAEVGNSTGNRQTNRIDGLAISIYPSRGLEIIGIEIKSSRSDWLREKSNPKKADSIFKFCNRWYLVAADDSIAQVEEIPHTWGLLVFDGKKLRQKVAAPKLEPQHITVGFLASIIRNVVEGYTPTKEIEDKLRSEYERGRNESDYGLKADAERFKKEMEHYKKLIADFEQVSGVRLTNWSRGNISKAMELADHGLAENYFEQIDRLSSNLITVGKSLGHTLELARKFEEERKKENAHA